MDRRGVLILGPPASSWPNFNKWNANYVSYAGNTAQGLGLQPLVRVLPTPANITTTSLATKVVVATTNTQGAAVGGVVATACKYPGLPHSGCQTLGYASFDGTETLHRNLARQHLDATKWVVVRDGGVKSGSIVKKLDQPRDASDVFEWTNTNQGALTWIAALHTEDVSQTFPSVVGSAAYVAIQVSAQQNGTHISLGITTDTTQRETVSCDAINAREWQVCILTVGSVPSSGALTVSHGASPGAVWQLSDLVFSPIGATLSGM